MDKNFKDLLARFVNGNCTPEECDKINQWYERIADNDLELEEEEKRVIEARMLANIQKASSQRNRSVAKERPLFATALFKVAAAVVFLVVSGLWLLSDKGFLKVNPPGKLVEVTTEVIYDNTTKEKRLYKLPDGSTVRLNAFSILRFRKDFLVGDREVYLTGAAFFDIVKDSSRPFYVYSGQIATRVLGTSFFVDASPGATKVGVKVVTGKVSVFQIRDSEPFKSNKSPKSKNSTANGVVLSPNQKVDYYIDGGHWVTGLVEDPVPVKPIDVETLSFVFSNTPIEEVLEDINERFGIEVVAENERISQCAFTGDVSKMPLYDMLDVISNSIGSTYEVKGTRILVSGKGCNGAQP